MNDQPSECLGHAKQAFISLLSKLSPGESKDFLDWIIEQHSSLKSDETSNDVQGSLSNAFQQCVHAEESLQSIIEDLRGRVPLSGVCGSEIMFKPEIGQVETNCIYTISHKLFSSDDHPVISINCPASVKIMTIENIVTGICYFY